MTEDQIRQQGEARKARSIARLRREGVPTIEHLPRIECDPATIQDLEAIAHRTMVIALLAVYAEPDGMPIEVLEQYLDLRGVRQDLTKKGRAFVATTNPPDELRGAFTWQYECANVLLWALGYVHTLGSPTTLCTAQGVSAIVAPRSLVQLMGGATSRSADEIFEECDLIFRYHCAARQAYLTGQKPPAGLITPLCFYRHYALNWLVDRTADWDDVDTST